MFFQKSGINEKRRMTYIIKNESLMTTRLSLPELDFLLIPLDCGIHD
ncbi:hypothetical protein JOC86_004432 [Bacillus pakistanensis]|uniref:Uncharacterized protein n=1 Tax=Rossellomorea pakistanensis TaxID=992288 RepID=A0ABS2NJ21_9BACI|nr:hypothetical protein [Bacillus pakistanensis]